MNAEIREAYRLRIGYVIISGNFELNITDIKHDILGRDIMVKLNNCKNWKSFPYHKYTIIKKR